MHVGEVINIMFKKVVGLFVALIITMSFTACSSKKVNVKDKQAPTQVQQETLEKPDYYATLPAYNGLAILEKGLSAMKDLKSYQILAHTTVQENDKFKEAYDEEFVFISPDKYYFKKVSKDTKLLEEIQIGSNYYKKVGDADKWEKQQRPEVIKSNVTLDSIKEDFEQAKDVRLLMDENWEGIDVLAVSFLVKPDVYPGVMTRVNYFFNKNTNHIVRIERINEKNGRKDYSETFYRFENINNAPEIKAPQA